MLVDGREVLGWADDTGTAAAAFNVYDLDSVNAAVDAAQAEDVPVFLAVGPAALRADHRRGLPALMVAAARAATVPVAVHLDHGDSAELASRQVAEGFTSVMVDGSTGSDDDNAALVRATRELVGLVPIEAELGGIGGDEDRSGTSDISTLLTDPDAAARFVAAAQPDSLAVAIGNAHGAYTGEPHLDLERLAAIRDAVPVPLVLHGASGLPADALRTAIGLGVRKVNVNTELRQARLAAVRAHLADDPDGDDVLTLGGAMVTAMTQAARRVIGVLSGP